MNGHSQREHRIVLWLTEREAKACERFLSGRFANEQNDVALTRAVLRQVVTEMEPNVQPPASSNCAKCHPD